MVLARATPRYASHLYKQSLRSSRNTLRSKTWQRSQRRSYASSEGEAGHGSHKSSSDLPWAITSIAVSVPAIWYLAQPQIDRAMGKGSHGHGGHGHDEEHHDKEGEESGESHPEDAEQSADSDASEGGKEEDSGSEDSTKGDSTGDDTPNTSADEGSEDGAQGESKPRKEGQSSETRVIKEGGQSEDIDGVKWKGSTNATEDGTQSHQQLHMPDAKGYNKKRIYSDYGQKLGEAEKDEQDPQGEDLGASSKPPAKGFDTMTGKQDGLANTDTKHSTDIQNSPDKSKKGEGVPETAKLKGTVDPNRPLR